MADTLNRSMIMKALDYAYDKAVNGLPGCKTAEELAQDYINGGGSLRDNAKKLVRWQTAKAGASGFATGLGGLITMPVAIPANISSVLYVQIRMIAAIATMGRLDVRNDQIRTLVYMCLCGSAITDIAKDVGIRIGSRLTEQAIKNISKATILKINHKVGFRLLTKFGEKGVVNLGKLIPCVGGVIGGAIDSATTKTIGKVAIDFFIESEK